MFSLSPKINRRKVNGERVCVSLDNLLHNIYRTITFDFVTEIPVFGQHSLPKKTREKVNVCNVYVPDCSGA